MQPKRCDSNNQVDSGRMRPLGARPPRGERFHSPRRDAASALHRLAFRAPHFKWAEPACGNLILRILFQRLTGIMLSFTFDDELLVVSYFMGQRARVCINEMVALFTQSGAAD
jgi:hypothetical protein